MPPSSPSPPDWILLLDSPEATEAFGRALGERLEGGDVVLLRGELGAGKTRLAAGIGAGLATAERAISPTYVVRRDYPARDGLWFRHFDFYRLSGDDDAEAIGVEEARAPDSVVVVEWPEICPNAFPDFTLEMRLTPTDESVRRVEGRWGPGAGPEERERLGGAIRATPAEAAR